MLSKEQINTLRQQRKTTGRPDQLCDLAEAALELHEAALKLLQAHDFSGGNCEEQAQGWAALRVAVAKMERKKP